MAEVIAAFPLTYLRDILCNITSHDPPALRSRRLLAIEAISPTLLDFAERSRD
jgi:hypothetical protein